MRVVSVIVLTAIVVLSATGVYGQEKEIRSVHIGLLYPLSTNGITAPEYSNRFSLHAIGGISGGELGICLSGFGHITAGNLEGIQLSGFGNFILGDAQGASVAGFGNVTGNSKGVQVAGFGNVSNNMRGIQVAGFGNVAADTDGLQVAGFGNVSRSSEGLQVAGFGNISSRNKGVQAAGFFNATSEMEGIQVAGFLNASRNVKGIQVAGFMNIAGRVDGLQAAGFINIADSSDYPIGIINIIGNGEMYVQTYTDEMQNYLLSFRSGSRTTYGFIGFGMNNHTGISNDISFSTEVGVGLQLHPAAVFRVRGELFYNQIVYQGFSDTAIRNGFRVLGDVNLGPLHLFAGAGLSVVQITTAEFEHPWIMEEWKNNRYLLPGIIAGAALKIK